MPTFCFNVPGHSAERVATFLGERDVAVWHGDYYAVETMKHLGLGDGAVRAGSSTTTPRRRSTACSTDSLRSREAPPSRRAEIPRSCDHRRGARTRTRADVLQSWHDESGAVSGGRAHRRRPEGRSRRARRAELGRGGRHVRIPPARRAASSAALAESGLYCFVSSISVYADQDARGRGQPARRARWPAGRRRHERELRRAQGTMRERRARHVRRARARRSPGTHRRAARPDGSLHVLAAPRRSRW